MGKRKRERSKGRFVVAAAMLGCVVLAAPQLVADTVYLQSGEVLSGKILRASKEEVSIQLDSGGVLSFRAGRLLQVRRQRPLAQGGVEVINYADGADGPESSPSQPPAPPVREQLPPQQGAPHTDPAFPLFASRGAGGQRLDAESEASDDGTAEAETAIDSPAKSEATRQLVDTKNRFSMVLPSSFEPWADHHLQVVLHAFRDPITQANATVSAFSSAESIDRIKESIVRMLPRRSSARIVNELRFNVNGARGFRGWLLELENDVDGAGVRQLQLLAKPSGAGRGKVLIVTFSCAKGSYEGLVDSFRESLSSFRFAASPSKAQSQTQDHAVPKEVEEFLRNPPADSGVNGGPSDGPPSRGGNLSDIDPYTFSPDANHLIDRVNAKARQHPLVPYTIK